MILTSDFSVEEGAWAMESLTSPMVIKSAKLTLESAEPREASQDALRLVAERGGYVVESELFVRKHEEAQRFRMVARVPAVEFESLLLSARKIGTPTEEWVRGAGVTEEVRELEEKLGIKAALEEGLEKVASKAHSGRNRHVEIIGSDRETVVRAESPASDAVEAERELADVREDMAALKAKTAGLERQVAMSTVELTIQRPAPEPPPPAAPPTFGEQLEAAFSSSAKTMMTMSLFLIRGIAALLPIALFASPALVAAAVWRRRRRALA